MDGSHFSPKKNYKLELSWQRDIQQLTLRDIDGYIQTQLLRTYHD